MLLNVASYFGAVEGTVTSSVLRLRPNIMQMEDRHSFAGNDIHCYCDNGRVNTKWPTVLLSTVSSLHAIPPHHNAKHDCSVTQSNDHSIEEHLTATITFSLSPDSNHAIRHNVVRNSEADLLENNERSHL